MIKFTEKARERVLAFMAQEEGDLAVRIAVRDSSPLAPAYDLALIEPEERTAEDRVFDDNGFDLVVDPQSVDLLGGASVDWVETLDGSGFHVENPNIKPIGSEPLSGPLAERVERVIRERVNPGIAAHGGQVALVDIRDDIAYLRMSGGCQGCAMSTVTLYQGIRRIFAELVPEIEDVRDVTDHAAGTDPYYQHAG